MFRLKICKLGQGLRAGFEPKFDEILSRVQAQDASLQINNNFKN